MCVAFKQVSFSYRDGGMSTLPGRVNLDLTIKPGQMVTVLGAPGSGKSTLLQHINGLLKPDQGVIHVLDYKLDASKSNKPPIELRRRVGLVFQYPEQQLFEETVAKDLAFGPLNFGASKEEAEQAAKRVAHAMGLDASLLEKSPFQLSSGQMRKAAIAAVIASEPDLLLLDEPTASLDPVSRRELMQLLQNQCRTYGRSVIMVTHRLEEAMPFTDEFIVMHQGRLLFQGDAAALLERQDVLEAAGLAIPPAYLLTSKLTALFELESNSGYIDPAELAVQIKQRVLERER